MVFFSLSVWRANSLCFDRFKCTVFINPHLKPKNYILFKI
ncbi:hypothetical protein LEP1GSC008_3880 [Leptospira kirschneri serovar Bulgarica str. Nikolaevo]|uniref:Uncharacterized protein n=1 Tax=Leptospira kirschneri serovar Bulgarica str. Nikolaevo TaxID=1240687 RepID=M6FCZ2_9LEPT|nr:hypothetical protein LEP1GSC008_3880 [Leptospira kirschneri serovar Bulgarica str. Nikolaevo]